MSSETLVPAALLAMMLFSVAWCITTNPAFRAFTHLYAAMLVAFAVFANVVERGTPLLKRTWRLLVVISVCAIASSVVMIGGSR